MKSSGFLYNSELEETVDNALHQIKEKEYASELLEAGIAEENIRMYEFDFEGKRVLIGSMEINN